MQVELLTKADLEPLQQSINYLTEMLSGGLPARQEPADKLLSRKETILRIPVCLSTLDNLAKQGKIKPTKVGKSVFYRIGDIENYLKGPQNEKKRK